MPEPDAQQPEFPITLRGYDREFVDQYIERLQDQLEDALERGRETEPEPVQDWHAQISPRVAQIFELATEEAEDIRSSAERAADLVLFDARQEAADIVAAAGSHSEELSIKRDTEWASKLADFQSRRDRLQHDVEELEQRKAAVLEELRRLHAALGMTPGMAPAAGPPQADADQAAEAASAAGFAADHYTLAKPEPAEQETAPHQPQTPPALNLLGTLDRFPGSEDATQVMSGPDDTQPHHLAHPTYELHPEALDGDTYADEG